MIRIKNLSRKFEFDVLHDINYQFQEGNIYVIKGISGSGKTTLLNIISGLDRNYKGECLFNDLDIKSLTKSETEEYRNNIGYILQDSLLIHNLTVMDNLKFIENNEEKIKTYSKKFGVDHLLSKMPNEISGGERQRFSLIRSLLLDSKIILADEPTSSLDKENSKIFANFIKELKNQNKIVIIATHKDIYDKMADSIINISFGEIKIIKENKKKQNKKNLNKILEYHCKKKENFNFKSNFKYINSRIKEHKSIILTLFLITLFIILFFSISLKLNFKEEYIKKRAQLYPYNVLSVNPNSYRYLEDIITKVYDEYIVSEDGYTGYVLTDKEDSNFTIPGIIKYGSFPKNNSEVLVNIEYIKKKNPNMKVENIIGQKIIIKNEKFIISGIIEKGLDNYFEVYECNPYYDNINLQKSNGVSQPAVFIPYEKIKKIGHKVNNEFNLKLVVIDKKMVNDLYNGKVFNELNKPLGGNYQSWENKINSVSKNAVFIANMSLLILIFISLISILFVSNQISINLFYRKKELGYLQLFRVSKKRIIFIYFLEYLLSIGKPLIFSIIFYNIICILLYLLLGYNFFLHVSILLLISVIVIIYCVTITIVPTIKYLKKDIISLIR